MEGVVSAQVRNEIWISIKSLYRQARCGPERPGTCWHRWRSHSHSYLPVSESGRLEALRHIANPLPVLAHSVRLSTSCCVHAFFISCSPGNFFLMNVDRALSDVNYVLLGLLLDTSIYLRCLGTLCYARPGNTAFSSLCS